MVVRVIASSSSGNCIVIDDGTTRLMLDCGLRKKELRNKYIGSLSQFSGVLVTHEHKDHCKGVSDMLSYSVPVYMSEGTKTAMSIDSNLIKVVKSECAVRIETFVVLPFAVEHDCAEPLGFMVYSSITNEKLLFITDSKYVKYKFSDIDYLLVECNYSMDIIEENVKKGKLNEQLAERIIDSHFGLDNVKDMIDSLHRDKLKAVYLLHLSDNNSDQQRFVDEIQELVCCPVYVGGK